MALSAALPNIHSTSQSEWRALSQAALRVGQTRSLDELLLHALDCWLEQVTPTLRWNIAVDLYTSEQVSLGRAAEIAGLNYFVFMEKLREADISLVDAHVETEMQRRHQQAILDEILSIPT